MRRVGLDAGAAPDAGAFDQLLARVSQAYADTDQDRYLLERTQAVASLEMAELNSALQASQARLSSLLDLSSDWVWEQNPKGRFTFVSESMAQRSGLDNIILLGQTFTPDGALRVAAPDLARWAGHLERRQPFRDLTFELTAGDGRVFHMSISGEPWFDGAKFKGYRGVGVDVTTPVEADRRLQENARRRLFRAGRAARQRPAALARDASRHPRWRPAHAAPGQCAAYCTGRLGHRVAGPGPRR